jgi:hypothetical protein
VCAGCITLPRCREPKPYVPPEVLHKDPVASPLAAANEIMTGLQLTSPIATEPTPPRVNCVNAAPASSFAAACHAQLRRKISRAPRMKLVDTDAAYSLRLIVSDNILTAELRSSQNATVWSHSLKFSKN